MNLIDQQINKYCENVSDSDSDLLVELREYTFANDDVPQMISGSQVGNILKALIQISNSKNVLEVGTFTGYSALKMSEALPDDGILHTCEIMDRHVEVAQDFIDRSTEKNKITILHGNANKTLEQLKSNYYDFAFIDADKSGYLDYYKKCMVLIKTGGIIVLDNMLWSGHVLQPKDDDTNALVNTANFINNDNRCSNFLMTIRDGLMVCIKK